MKRIRIIVLLVAVYLAAATMVACDNKKNFETLPENREPIKTYVVGTEPGFPPFESLDECQSIVGFDMDLISAIARDQNFMVHFRAGDFSSLIEDLQVGNIDIIASGMNATEERKLEIAFSNTYYQSGLVIAVENENTEIQGIDSLQGEYTVGAQEGTTSAEMIKKLYDEGKIEGAKIYPKLTVLMLSLQEKGIDAVINDRVVTESYMKKQNGKIKAVGDLLNSENYAFGVRNSDKELLDKINKGLKNIQESGTFEKLHNKWFD